jgi:hypothetical protein
MDQSMRKLREEFSDQRSAQRRLIDAENDFFASAKGLEMQRHNDAVATMDENHKDRVQRMKAQEEQYVGRLAQMRTQYLTKKRAMVRGFQRDLKRVGPFDSDPHEDDCHCPDIVADGLYAGAVAAEIIRLRTANPEGPQPGKVSNRKLRLLVEELEAYIRLTY